MPDFKFSSKLQNYLKKIEIETGKEVKVLESPHLGLKGMWAAFRYHPKFIVVIIRSNIEKTNDDLERSIAHEATHGYILFKKKYCRPDFTFTAEDNDKKDIQLLFTMIDDIVVNKIISEYGFSPYGSEYIPAVMNEIESMLAGVDIYRKFSDDLLFDDLLMITRYIIAWGFLEYFELDSSEYNVIKKFRDVFEYTYPLQYKIANEIKQIITLNNIFTSDGHCNAIEEILKRLKFSNLVEIVNIN
ncbi:hypothetical protein [Methanobacterium oryzae]|uniref:hypothetical protein n=1 Tax=Methanobacterium oryzae TaxID=69540 RepID=UPI003D248148